MTTYISKFSNYQTRQLSASAEIQIGYQMKAFILVYKNKD